MFGGEVNLVIWGMGRQNPKICVGGVLINIIFLKTLIFYKTEDSNLLYRKDEFLTLIKWIAVTKVLNVL